MIKTMDDNNLQIKAGTDAAHYYAISGYQKSYIVKDYGEKFDYKISSLKVSVGKGIASIFGRHIHNDGSVEESVTVNPNTKGFIVLRYDKGNRIGEETTLEAVSTIVQENILENGSVYDLELYEYTSTSNSVKIIKDLRTYAKDWKDEDLWKQNTQISINNLTNLAAKNGSIGSQGGTEVFYNRKITRIDNVVAVSVFGSSSAWEDKETQKPTKGTRVLFRLPEGFRPKNSIVTTTMVNNGDDFIPRAGILTADGHYSTFFNESEAGRSYHANFSFVI